jgi:hypothetical protein
LIDFTFTFKGEDDMATNTLPGGDFRTEDVKNKVKEVGNVATEKAKTMAAGIGQKAEDATAAVGDSMKSLAGTIREHSPQTGMLGSASTSVAQGLECGADYLQHQGLQGIANDLTTMIRRNPIPALFVGFGVGFLAARALSRR